ncbi:MAG: hypothetical protein M5U12_21330 [Verrucomicrobia bacterium]|nr:hypothetical protein [Verrucomicrobiota bacterium]
MKRYACLFPLALAGGLAVALADTLSYVDLVKRLTDLEALARLPHPRRGLRPVVQLRPRQPLRRGLGQVPRLGCQRRRRRLHPQGG